MHQNTHHQTHHQVQQGDQQTGNRIAFDELRCTIKRAKECGFALVIFTASPGGGMVNGTSGHIAVDGQLLTRHTVQCETGAHLSHPGRALGDDHEVHDQQHPKDHEAQENTAAHHELGKALDNITSRIGSGVTLTNDEFRGGDVQ